MRRTTPGCSPLCNDAGHCPSCRPEYWVAVPVPRLFHTPKRLLQRFDHTPGERRRALSVLIGATRGFTRDWLVKLHHGGFGLYRIADGFFYLAEYDNVSYAADPDSSSRWGEAAVQFQSDEANWTYQPTPSVGGPRNAVHYRNTKLGAYIHLWVAVADLGEAVSVEARMTSPRIKTRTFRTCIGSEPATQDSHVQRFAEWVQDTASDHIGR